MAIESCMVVLRPIPTSVDVERMLLHIQVIWSFTAAWRFYQQIKSSSVTLVFMSPDELYSVLCPLVDYMANATARTEDGAHGLSQLGQPTKVVSPTFGLTPCPFLAHSGLFVSARVTSFSVRSAGQSLLVTLCSSNSHLWSYEPPNSWQILRSKQQPL